MKILTLDLTSTVTSSLILSCSSDSCSDSSPVVDPLWVVLPFDPPEANSIKIGLPGKLILGDYFQENMISRRPFLESVFREDLSLYNCPQDAFERVRGEHNDSNCDDKDDTAERERRRVSSNGGRCQGGNDGQLSLPTLDSPGQHSLIISVLHGTGQTMA